uniref:Uncharacterized protein n=1 Tax=candidate division WOR-3 bacterium TaxID=2052148 RepID=A0A7V3ZWK0_UNCW3
MLIFLLKLLVLQILLLLPFIFLAHGKISLVVICVILFFVVLLWTVLGTPGGGYGADESEYLDFEIFLDSDDFDDD